MATIQAVVDRILMIKNPNMNQATPPSRKLMLLDPFHKGSHAAFAQSVSDMLSTTGQWEVDIRPMPGAHWKWRMQGAAAHFALELAQTPPADVILTTDMCDVSRLRGLLPEPHRNVPIVVYFHENQLTFPWSTGDPDLASRIDLTYGMTNVMTALAADQTWFNSHFHRRSFLNAARALMNKMPDARIHLKAIETNSRVMHIPLPLDKRFGSSQEDLRLDRPLGNPVRLLWNHRWSRDKGMDRFLEQLHDFEANGISFELILLGIGAEDDKSEWTEPLRPWRHCILHQGTARSAQAYKMWLSQADVIVHHPRQEFFGISLVEAMWHGVLPIVPREGPYPEYVPETFLSNSATNDLLAWQKTSSSQVAGGRHAVHHAVTQFCHTTQHNFWLEALGELCC